MGAMVKRTAILILAAAVLASCSRGAGPAPAPGSSSGSGPAAPLPEVSPVSGPVFPEDGQAEVVRIGGGVEILRSGSSLPAVPGALLALGDRIRTGAEGSVEIRLTGLASFLLPPDSEAEIRAARLFPGAAHAEVFVAAGSVLFDVRTLSGRESFLVSTDRSLSGVRGTRFRVSAGEVSGTAVREGRVAVLPAGPVLKRLAEAARTDGTARAALRTLVSLAPVADPGREIRVDGAARDRAEAAYRGIETALAVLPPVPLPPDFPGDPWFSGDLPDLPEPDGRAREALARARASAAAARSALPVPVTAGPETLRGFERFRDLRSGPSFRGVPVPGPVVRTVHAAESGRTKVAARALAGSLVRSPDSGLLFAADESGGLFALGPDGEIRWSLRAGDPGQPRGYPVTFKDAVYSAGTGDILAVDGITGTVLARRTLDPGTDPGTRPVPFPDSLLLPVSGGIEVLDPRTLKTKTTIPLAAGPGTLPVQRDSFALVVDREGTLLVVDPVSGTIQARTSTGSRGYTAVSPRILEEKACFADRTGLVVMVDLERMAVLWERRTGVPVLTDLEIAREGVLVYGGGTLFGYRLDGEPLMPPVPGVSAPPLLSRGVVYYGTEKGEIVAAQASPWRIRGAVPLGDVASVRPLLVGETLYVGTRGGQLVRIDVAKLPL